MTYTSMDSTMTILFQYMYTDGDECHILNLWHAIPVWKHSTHFNKLLNFLLNLQALLRQEREVWKADRLLAMDERKRPYNSMFTVQEPTEEEMEAYRLKKRREEDPMSHF